MFKRILVEDWVTYVPVISFVLVAGAFIAITIHALRIDKNKRDRLASLPLEDQPENLKSP